MINLVFPYYQNHLNVSFQNAKANSNNQLNIVGVTNGFSLDYNYLLNCFTFRRLLYFNKLMKAICFKNPLWELMAFSCLPKIASGNIVISFSNHFFIVSKQLNLMDTKFSHSRYHLKSNAFINY